MKHLDSVIIGMSEVWELTQLTHVSCFCISALAGSCSGLCRSSLSREFSDKATWEFGHANLVTHEHAWAITHAHAWKPPKPLYTRTFFPPPSLHSSSTPELIAWPKIPHLEHRFLKQSSTKSFQISGKDGRHVSPRDYEEKPVKIHTIAVDFERWRERHSWSRSGLNSMQIGSQPIWNHS